ncbi:MAG: pilin [Candidatus Altiarchaeota archaeon]|nr:pilin [Candidatus Altiarchaeota archaeon]
MEMKHRILLLLGVLICCTLVSAKFIDVRCTCECKGGLIIAVGVYPKQVLEFEETEYMNAMKKCHEQCGADCGGYVDYESDLGKDCSNCGSFCSAQGFTGDEAEAACVESCRSKCGFNDIVYGIIDIIHYVVGIIAAVILLVNSYGLITSTTPEDRDNAKKGIICAILALVIAGVAGPLAKLMMEDIDPTAASAEFAVEILDTVYDYDAESFNPIVNPTTAFSFSVVNVGKGELTNVAVNVKALDYFSCTGTDVHSENLGDISPKGSKTYSYTYPCALPQKYGISLQSDQFSQGFCVRDCHGGACYETTIGSC